MVTAVAMTIWMYHRVLPSTRAAFGLPGCYALRGTAITPEAWADDLARLQPIVSLDAVVTALTAGRAPPAGHVLTFDDGYREWSELVVPSLRAADATATFFVTAGLHGGGRPHAIDAYYWLLDHAESAAWEVTLPDGRQAAGDLRTTAGKLALVTSSPIKRAIVAGDADVQSAILTAVAAATRCVLPRGLAAELYMDEAQWRTLALAGTIGAHGVEHRPWTLLDEQQLRDELVGGRERLVAATRGSVEFVAYPDGACDARVAAATRAAGYRAAVLASDGEIGDLFALPRVFRRGDDASGLYRGRDGGE